MVGSTGLSSYESVVGDVEESAAEGAGCAGDRERVEEATEGGRVRDRFQRGSKRAGSEPIKRGESRAVRESDGVTTMARGVGVRSSDPKNSRPVAHMSTVSRSMDSLNTTLTRSLLDIGLAFP